MALRCTLRTFTPTRNAARRVALRPASSTSATGCVRDADATTFTACSSSSSPASQPGVEQQPHCKPLHPAAGGPTGASISPLLAALPVALLLLQPGACQAAELDPATAALVENVLRPLFNIYLLLYIVRIPMTWYPNLDLKALPWSAIAAPTEPFLAATRRVVPLVGGVDVTPIVWVAMISFFNEVLLGPQGILTLIQREVGV